MADGALTIDTAGGDKRVFTETIIDPTFGEVHLLRVVVENAADFPGGGSGGGGLTDAELRANPVEVNVDNIPHVIVDSMPAGGAGLTDAELRAAAVPVSGNFYPATQPVSGTFWQATQPVSGPLTDAQLRASGVPVTHGGLTDAQLRASGVPVTHDGLTDTQLRAAAVPVSGPLTDVQLRASAVPVSGPLTDAQLRATAVPVSMSSGGAYTAVGASNVAPAANAVQADTGALPAGTYDFIIVLMVSDTVAVGKGLIVEHRNAANGATLAVLGGVSAPESITYTTRLTLALNERVRVIVGTVAGAASSRYVSSIHRRLG